MRVTEWRADTVLTGERVIVLGFFDGVHLAHRRLIDLAQREAAARGAELCVLTFPTEEGRIKHGVRRLYETEEKLRLLAGAGVGHTVLVPFGAVADMTAEQFVSDVLCRQLGCTLAVSGFNYRFGRGASADADALVRLMRAAGREALIGAPVLFEGETLSTTLVRAMIARGDVRTAARALGAPFRLVGRAVHGRGIGRTLGIPTVNLAHTEGLVYPAGGVYRSVAVVNGVAYHAVTNVGTCPTLGEREEHTECTLLGYDGDLYGQTVRVYVLDRLRGERRFASADELKKQIELDKTTTIGQNPPLSEAARWEGESHL